MEEKKLNVDIAKSISRFRSVMKSFELRKKVYKRIIKRRGLEFESYRNYSQDDDSGLIDWKASKRANELLIKKYIEEENMKIFFLIDVGENMISGSSERLKCEYALNVIAALTDLILSSGNKVGYIVFNGGIKEFIIPKKGGKHFENLMSVMTNASLYGGSSHIEKAIDFTLKYLNNSVSSLVIVSDFVNFEKKEFEKKLGIISSKFETMAIIIRDPLDKTLPDISGEVIIEDPSTGDKMLINPSIARKSYEKYAKEEEESLRKIFHKTGTDSIELMTDKDFVFSLATFIKQRVKVPKGGIEI